MNRRSFLWTSIGISVLGISGVKVFFDSSIQADRSFYAGEMSALNDVAVYVKREAAISQADITKLELLLNSFDESDFKNNLEILIEKDFIHENTRQVQGWVLSYHECRFIVALAS